MEWLGKRKPKPTYEWKRWFAWFPVKTIEATWVWMQWVEKGHWLADGMTADQMRQSSTPLRPRRLIKKLQGQK
jgi:hypothetical protein